MSCFLFYWDPDCLSVHVRVFLAKRCQQQQQMAGRQQAMTLRIAQLGGCRWQGTLVGDRTVQRVDKFSPWMRRRAALRITQLQSIKGFMV